MASAAALGAVAPDPLLVVATGAIDLSLLGLSVAAAVGGNRSMRAAGIASLIALLWVRSGDYGLFRTPPVGLGPFDFLGRRGLQVASVSLQWLGAALSGVIAHWAAERFARSSIDSTATGPPPD